MTDELAVRTDRRCQCPLGVILWDCPVPYANGAHEDGTANGSTREELAFLAPVCGKADPDDGRLRCLRKRGHDGDCESQWINGMMRAAQPGSMGPKPAPARSAEEIALEMVPEPRRDDGETFWRSCIADDTDWVPLEPQESKDMADAIVADARALVVRLLQSGRAGRSGR